MEEIYPPPEGLADVEFPSGKAINMNVFKWALYDLGNTIFSMVIVSLSLGPLIYIMYYNQLGDGARAVNSGNYAISTTLLIGNIIMAFISPFLGAFADQQRTRKSLLMWLTMLCITFMAALIASAYTTSIVIVLVIFLFSNLFYQMGLVVYDSMIPFITTKENIGKVSGFGVALGYFGSFIGIGIGFLLIPIFGDFYASPASDTGADNFVFGYLPYIFPVSALMFLLFAFPMFTVKERENKIKQKEFKQLAKDVQQNVFETGAEILNYRQMLFFLIGWLIFVDAANTVIAFMSVMVSVGLEFGKGSIVLIVLAIGIGSAVVFTYPVGIFVDKYGPKKGLVLVFFFWVSALLLGIATNLTIGGIKTTEFLVYIFPLLVGPALGGSWVVQRQFINELAPPEKIGNYFGFTNIFGRISAAVGPFVWAISIDILQNMGFSIPKATRYAIFVLIFLMIIGFIILSTVNTPHEDYLKGARANGDGTWSFPSQGEQDSSKSSQEIPEFE